MFFPTFDFNILLHRNIIVAMIIKKNNSYIGGIIINL